MARDVWRIEAVTVALKLDLAKDSVTRHRFASLASAT
jgi:hypothetical protein